MKFSLVQLALLASLSAVAFLLLGTAMDVEARPAGAAQGAETKLAASIGVGPAGTALIGIKPQLKFRKYQGRAQECPLPSFDEVPHGEEGWADHYSYSEYDPRTGELIDYYYGGQLGASTGYFKEH